MLLALPVLLFALAFLLMPFSVFGVKGRLDSLEAQIDALHEDLRMLSLRSSGALGRPARQEADYDAIPDFERLKSSRQMAEPVVTPVLEPRGKPLTARPAVPRPQQRRMEPRLD